MKKTLGILISVFVALIFAASTITYITSNAPKAILIINDQEFLGKSIDDIKNSKEASDYINKEIEAVEKEVKLAVEDNVTVTTNYDFTNQGDFYTINYHGVAQRFEEPKFQRVEAPHLNVGLYEFSVPSDSKITYTYPFTYSDSNLVVEPMQVTNDEYNILIGTAPIDIPLPNGDVQVADQGSIIVVANSTRTLSSDFIPQNLKEITVESKLSGEHNLLVDFVVDDLEEMFNAAQAEGINLRVNSAYRSYQFAENEYNNYALQFGEEQAQNLAIKPGESEYQTGLLVTLGDANDEVDAFEDFSQTVASDWLSNNAHKYGFVIRYPKGRDAITNFGYNPRVYRYVGRDVAPVIHSYSLSLEEFLFIH